MMEENILGPLLSAASLEKPPLAQAALEKLRCIFQGNLGSVEASVYAAQALDTEDGIPKYVKNAILQTNATKLPTNLAFEIMEYVVVNYGKSVDIFSEKIVDWCMCILNLGVNRCEEKSKALLLVKALLKSCSCVSVDWVSFLKGLEAYMTQRNIAPTLRYALYDVIGVIFEVHPEEAEGFSAWFTHEISATLRLCEAKINQGIRESVPTLASAAFAGLPGVLEHYPPGDLTLFYRNLLLWCRLRSDRNTTSRMALHLFHTHAKIFHDLIFDDYQSWLEILMEWIEIQQTPEHKNLGLKALSSFFQVISKHIDETEDAKNYFRRFIMLAPAVLSHQKAALIGFSELSSIFQIREAQDLVHSLMFPFESLDNASLIVMQLETKAKVFSKIEISDWAAFGKLSISFIEKFPQLEPLNVTSCLESFGNAWKILLQDGSRHHVASTVVYQGLILSTACHVHQDVELLQATDIPNKLVSYKDFVPFWKHLLTISSREPRQKASGKATYDAFITSFLQLISKLDLSLVVLIARKSDPLASMEANCPNDFRILANLVDLFQEVIPQSDVVYLNFRINEVIEFCIREADKNHLVSGFAKVLTTCFQVLDKESLKCSPKMIDFLKRTILRLVGQKDELLISNLKMILAAPVSCVQPSWDLLEKVVEGACRAGRGRIDVLTLCIEALDKWYSKFPLEKSENLIKVGMRLLTPILINPSTEISGPTDLNKSALKSKGKIKKKSVSTLDNRVFSLQKKFLLLMSKVEPSLVLDALEPSDIQQDSNLSYKLQMSDQALDLNLSKLLPRIKHLALSSCDRNTRFTACQMVHSFMLLAISKVNQSNGNLHIVTNEQNQNLPFQELLAVCLSLSCDNDVSISQLFKPLVKQMAHLYSNSGNVASQVSECFVESLFESAANQYDSALCDFSAECVSEYLSWAIQQDNNKQFSIAKYNIIGIVRKICEFSTHPEVSKRQAAATIFNGLYKKIRVERNVVLNYWLRLHWSFTLALENSSDGDDSGQIKSAIVHVQRAFLEKPDLFERSPENKASIPPGYGSGTMPDLISVYFKHCRSSNSHLREIAYKFLEQLVARSPSTLQSLFQQHGTNDFLRDEVPKRISEHIGTVQCISWLVQMKAIKTEEVKNENLNTSSLEILKNHIDNDSQILTSSDVEILLKYFNLICCMDDEFFRIVYQFLISNHPDGKGLDVDSIEKEIVIAISRSSSERKIAEFNSLCIDDFHMCPMIKNDQPLSKYWRMVTIFRKVGFFTQLAETKILKSIFDRMFTTTPYSTDIENLEKSSLACYNQIIEYLFLHNEQTFRFVLELVTDESKVTDQEQTTTKGDWFFQNYQEVLVAGLLRERELASILFKMGEIGSNWLKRLLDISKNKNLARSIVENWALGKDLPMLDLLSMAQSVGFVLKREQLGNIPHMKKWFIDITYPVAPWLTLSDSEVDGWFKTLPYFVSTGFEETYDLLNALRYFKRRLWMHGSSQSQLALHNSVLKSLEATLIISCNVPVFDFFIVAVLQHPENLTDDWKTQFCSGIAGIPNNVLLGIAEFLTTMILQECVIKEEVLCLKDFFVAILMACSKETCKAIFDAHLHNVNYILVAELTNRNDRMLLRKIAAVDILRVVYIRMDQNDRARWHTILNNSVRAAKFLSLESGPDCELKRLYNCSVALCLCSISLAHNSCETALNTLVLNENLFKSIIDPGLQYNLKMDFDSIPKTKCVATAISRGDTKPKAVPAYVRYANSSTLRSSSLSTELQQFDLTHMSVTSTPVINLEYRPVELELDELNKHEVMAEFCALFRLLTQKCLFSWSDYLVTSLASRETPPNGMLFVLKVVYNLNCQGLILEHGLDEKFGDAVLNAIVHLFPTCNYFLVDMIQMLLSWKPVLMCFSSQGNNLLRVVEIICTDPGTNQKHVIKHLMETLSQVIEQWGHLLDGRELTKILKAISERHASDEVMNYLSLRFASILLGHSLLNFEVYPLDAVLPWLINSTRGAKNLQLAAECLGQVVAQVRPVPAFSPYVSNALLRMEKAVEILCHMNTHCPIIEDDFIDLIKNTAWQEQSEYKARALRVILSYVKYHSQLAELQTFFPTLAHNCLSCGIPDAQICILEIILHVFETLDMQAINMFLEKISDLSEHPNCNLRLAAVQVLVKIASTEGADDSKGLCKIALTRGLTDSEERIRECCIDFWSKKLNFSSSEGRLSFIFERLYHPESETTFLEGAARFLLREASTLVNFQDPIVSELIANCTYNEQKMLLSWRMRNSGLAALFVPSISTELCRLEQDLPDGSQNHELRESAKTLLFSSTFDGNSSFNSGAFATPSGPSSSSSMSFKTQRFTRSQAELSASFAERHTRNLIANKQMAEECQKEREEGLVTFRRYKVGCYPDVQVTHSELVKMLDALISKDAQVAKELFMCLFEAVTFTTGLSTIHRHLIDISQASRGADPLTVSAMFEVALSKDLTLPASQVSRLSAVTGLLSVGALIIERGIESGEDLQPEKRSKSEFSEPWQKLAEIYYKMNDLNAVHGIFLDELNVEGAAKEAISSEIVFDWVKAKKCYEEVMTSDINSFYQQSYLTCLEKLSDWTGISKTIGQTVGESETLLWNDPWCRDLYLPWHMKSKMVLSLSNGNTDFQDYVKACPPDRFEHLSKYTEELTVAYWLDRNVSKTILNNYKGITKFLKNWSALNDWDMQMKKSLLENLQLLSGITRIVNAMSENPGPNVLTNFLEENGAAQPGNRSHLPSWDVNLQLEKRLGYLMRHITDTSDFDSVLIDKKLAVCEAALFQGNLSTTRMFLKNMLPLSNTQAQDPRWRDIRHRASIEEAKGISDRHQRFTVLSGIRESMTSSCSFAPSGWLDADRLTLLMALSEMSKVAGSLEEQLRVNADWLEETKVFLSSTKNSQQAGNVLVQLASFLQKTDSNEDMVEALLKAMAFGNSEATLLFGGIFTLDTKPQSETIIELAKKVPAWKFLIWRNQLLDYNEECPNKLFQLILRKLADLYPSSLGYSLRLYTKKSAFIRELSSIALKQSEEVFVQEIGRLANPFVKACQLIDNALKSLSSGSNELQDTLNELSGIFANPSTNEAVLVPMKGQVMALLNTNMDEMKPILEKLRGDIKIAQDPRPLLLEILSKLRANLTNLDLVKVKELTMYLKDTLEPYYANQYYGCIKDLAPGVDLLYSNIVQSESISEKAAKITINAALKSMDDVIPKLQFSFPKNISGYSTFLGQFQGMDGEPIEVPGQYGEFEPDPAKHIVVSYFKKRVTPILSKREPLKITMVGNDGKEYNFLFKFGEDLRQDERIQRCMSQMKGTLNNSNLVVYSVIPMTPSYGLIQWVESSKCLRELIESNEPDFSKKIIKMRMDHVDFLGQGLRETDAHRQAYLWHSPEKLIEKYQELVRSFDPHLLRKSFLRMSSSPQHFFTIRSNFATSLATMNIALWILGVGDRHLENTLILANGKTVAIDFGMSFGYATAVLPVPELVPFRLTPQMLNLLGPLKEKGWVKQVMVETLKTLTKDPSVLLAILEVFVREETTDWVTDSALCHNFSKSTIDDVKLKFTGHNPVKYFESNLKYGKKEYALKTLHGYAPRLRKSLTDDTLSPEDQVNVLLDLATDPMILSLIYVGWTSWL